jgi:peroxiredoxin Q/BCP
MEDAEKIHPGQLAPDFTLPDQDGRSHTLSDYRGQWVFLYLYPKGETQDGAAEACALRDRFENFKRHNAVILGISIDSVENHRRFAARYRLPFALLSDARKKVSQKYHALASNLSESDGEGIERTSFLIDVMGDVERVYKNVRPKTHAEEVLRDLEEMGKEG